MTRRKGNTSIERRKALEILAVEGSSEKIYFDGLLRLGDTDLLVRTINCHGGDIRGVRHVCECMLDERNPSNDDYLGVVMDVDNTPRKDILEFIEWCEKRGIEVYISNPSFEVFLLMHFTNVPSSLSQHDLEESLGRQLGRKYDKARSIRISDESVMAAIGRADRALPSKLGTRECIEHPGTTTVHRLVTKIASRFK